MNLITRFKQTCAELNPDLDLALNECDDNSFLDPITEAHWQGYQMRDSECPLCDNEGYILQQCCSGRECGCMGQPVSMINCVSCNPNGDRRETEYIKKYSPYVEYIFNKPIPPLTTKGGE